MASIKVADLRPIGSDLFSDSQSFLNEISEEELGIEGGGTPLSFVIVSVTIAASYIKGRWF